MVSDHEGLLLLKYSLYNSLYICSGVANISGIALGYNCPMQSMLGKGINNCYIQIGFFTWDKITFNPFSTANLSILFIAPELSNGKCTTSACTISSNRSFVCHNFFTIFIYFGYKVVDNLFPGIHGFSSHRP